MSQVKSKDGELEKLSPFKDGVISSIYIKFIEGIPIYNLLL